MGSEQKDRLSYAIVRHLQSLTTDESISEESRESLSVGFQCLSEALGIDLQNTQQALTLNVDKSLQEIFNEAYPAPIKKAVSKDDEAKAANIKDQGNELMKQNKYEEAIEKYTQAIDISPNAIFYCNRAAAFSKVGRHDDAVNDAKSALQLDPEYGKAYARMGFAYLSMNKLTDAQASYERALSLDPNNQSYKDNLDAVKEKIALFPEAAAGGTSGGAPPFPGQGGMPNLGGMDFNQILNNPMFVQMTQQLMNDPNMRNRFAQMADSFLGGMAGGNPEPGQMPDFSAMMNDPALRQVAENMEQQNPELLDNLRNMFRPPEGDGTDPNPPPP